MQVQTTACPICRVELNPDGECVGCLLRVGLGDTDPDFPRQFGDFQLDCHEDGSPRELGRGAMGVTYRATDRVLHRPVALKVVETPDGMAQSPAVRERFLREARGAAGLHHPNVAEVFQFGAATETDHAYYAMELIDGETLQERVRRDGPLGVAAALEVAVQVADALTAAATRGLVHRDLKPGNLMLTHGASGAGLRVKVIDFGLARAIASAEDGMNLTHGGFVGTPAFASPEQFRGDPADARSDIYSLGVTLWYALTGEVPFRGRSIEEIRRCQSETVLPVGQLTARQVPGPVIALLTGVLASEPAGRPPSAAALLAKLEQCRRTVEATVRRGQRRTTWALGLAVAACAAVLSGSVVRTHRAAAPLPAARADGRSTSNAAAYEAYVRGLAMISHDIGSTEVQGKAIEAFSEAVRLDPSFALAWARLSMAHGAVYWGDGDTSPARLAGVQRSLEIANKLDPELGEVFLARGYVRYRIEHRYEEAIQVFTQATERLPNQAEGFLALGAVQRRVGRWEDALASFARAARADPLYVPCFSTWGWTCAALGRYPEARAILDRGLAIVPGDARLITCKARTCQCEGDVESAGRLLAPLPLLPIGNSGRQVQIDQWFYERRYSQVIGACLAALQGTATLAEYDRGDTLLVLALACRDAGDPAALPRFREAREIFERERAARPDNAQNLPSLALVEAELGERAAALRDGEKAVSLTANDPIGRASSEVALARVCAQLGEADRAIAGLPRLLQTPGSDATPGQLRLDPIWDPVRDDPKFAKLVNETVQVRN